MKKRIFSLALVLVLTMGMAVPALAAEGSEPAPEYRLVSVTSSNQGGYSFSYGNGGWLPTEITSPNLLDPVVIAYDDAGRIISYQDGYETRACVYDESGKLMEKTTSITAFINGESVTADTHTEYTYDEKGHLLTEVETNGDQNTTLRAYQYDEDGDLLSVDSHSDGNSFGTYLCEYTYDDSGCLTADKTMYESGETFTTKYVCDDEGREIEAVYDSGASGKTYYMPLLQGHGYASGFTSYFNVYLYDTAGMQVYYWGISCAEPQLTYDDNGYLTRVDDGAGNYIEFAYEPVP